MRSTVLAACLLVFATVAADAAALTVRVDCNQGQTLEKVLAKAQAEAPLTIEIVGTCVGNFRIWADGVRLRGLSPTESVLMAPQKPGDGSSRPVLEIDDADRTNLSHLSIRGGSAGIHAHGWDRHVSIIDCEISESEIGVWIDGGADAYVGSSKLHVNGTGLFADSSSWASVVGSEIRDNRKSLVALRNSGLGLVDSRVLQHSNSVAVTAEIQSSINIVDSSVSGYSEGMILAADRSKASLLGDTEVGCDLDGDCIGVTVLGGSIFYASAFTTVNGSVHVFADSFARFSRAEVHGGISVSEFSRVSLFDTTINGNVDCHPSGDAVCLSGTVAETSGCPSAPPVCEPSTPGGITSDPREGVAVD